MQQYRIYCLDEEGRFSKADEIKLADDAEAMAYARALHHNAPCEVWNGNRLVGKVDSSHSDGAGSSASALARS
jgi:hypothetical protein